MSALLRNVGNSVYWLQPLSFCVLLVAGLGLCLYLFITLKREIGGLAQRRAEERQRVDRLEATLSETRLAVHALETELREIERQTGMLVAPAAAPSGLNLSKRTQVLRMHRTGQDSAGIAATLALPRAEVELLIKVHRMVLEHL